MLQAARRSGQLLGGGALALVFVSAAMASVWLTVEDSRQRSLLGDIRTHPERLDFSGLVEWEKDMGGHKGMLTLNIQHWHPNKTRIDLVRVDHPRFKADATQLENNPLIQQGLSRLKKRLAASRLRRIWNGLWDEPLLLRNYRVRIETASAFLKREVQKVTILPLRPNRPWLELIVDRQHRVPLKMTQYAIDGSIAFRMTYRSIRFGRPSGKAPELGPGEPGGWSTRVPLAEALRSKTPPLLPSPPPPGFRLQAISRRRGGPHGRAAGRADPGPRPTARPAAAAWRLVYWDGVTRIVCRQTDRRFPGKSGRNHRLRGGFSNQTGTRTYHVRNKTNRSRTVVGRNGLAIKIREHAVRSFLRMKVGERTVMLVGPLKADALLHCISSIKPSSTAQE